MAAAASLPNRRQRRQALFMHMSICRQERRSVALISRRGGRKWKYWVAGWPRNHPTGFLHNHRRGGDIPEFRRKVNAAVKETVGD
jgi:hypothetical protein